MRALDWKQTPLGPPALWPQSLKTIMRAMLDKRRPLDDRYLGLFDLVRRTIAAAIADAQAYEAERRRAEAFAEIDRAKTAFFSNVSHEFRRRRQCRCRGFADDAAATGRT
ncbi:MAG: hypothetical protein WB646_19575 [Steroidobacteraceae bacterium]